MSTGVIPAAPTHPHLSEDVTFAWALRDTGAMVGRNLTVMRRLPQIMVFSLVQPVIFVLMFRYVFGGAIKVGGGSYVNYLMPGIFTQTVTFGAISTAVGLAEDKGKGLLERLRSLPMARFAVLGGRVLADTTRNVVIVLLMLIVGMLVGFRPHAAIAVIVLGIAVMVLFGLSLAWLFALIGLSVTNGEAAQAAAFPLLAPMTFASSAFVQTKTMPGWLQVWANHQPVSATANAVRACFNGGPVASKVVVAVAWSVGISIVLAPIAIRRYRRT